MYCGKTLDFLKGWKRMCDECYTEKFTEEGIINKDFEFNNSDNECHNCPFTQTNQEFQDEYVYTPNGVIG